MIQQTSTSFRFEAFFTASKQGKTGLAVTVDVYGPSGPMVTNGAATEVGGGFYSYFFSGANTSLGGAYRAVFKTTDTTVDLQHLPSLWEVGVAGVENLDGSVSSASAKAVLAYNSAEAVNARLTDARAAKIDNLDAAVSTRLSSASYVGPDNAAVTLIKAVTDKLAGMLEAATGGNFRFTVSALANGPGGSGGLTEAQDAILRDMGAKLVGDADRTASGDVYKDGEGVARLQVAFPTKSARRVTHL